MRLQFSISLSAVMAATTLGACSSPVTICGGLQISRATTPDTTTIKIGAATIAIGGENYDSCVGPPARQYVWHVADSTVVRVTPLDSIHARIMGLRAGHAVVVPAYAAGGDALNPVSVTVVP